MTLFIVGGEVMASCGHVEHRTTPPLGGASVMRESIADPAGRAMTRRCGWRWPLASRGCARLNSGATPHGEPQLMEVNARMPGALDTAIRSGVDFPLLIWQLATGSPVSRVSEYRAGVRTRWLHGELRWLRG